MQIENTFTVPLPVEQAWPVLLDVERVVACVPGATLESIDGDVITARMRVKLGPVTMTYRGQARFVLKDEAARRVVLEASGKDSKGAGTASATVQTSLRERGNETEVHVLTELKLTGKPAQFGRGAIQDVSSKLIERFAQALSAELAASGQPGADDKDGVRQAPAASPTDGVATRVATAPAAAGARSRSSDDALDLLDAAAGPIAKRAVPVGGALLLAVVAFLVWYFSRS